MRKILLLIIFVLVGCSQNTNIEPDETDIGATEPTDIEIPQETETEEESEEEQMTPFFPAHTNYHSTIAMPTVAVQARMDQIVEELYSQWKTRYFRTNPFDDTQAYIHWDGEEGITVSEGHGWGMMILAFMAGHDPFAQEDFDKMTRFYLAHTSGIDSRLMSWQQALDEENEMVININGNDSATDGDLDIAYALLMAHILWESNDEFNYLELALDSINGTMDSIVNEEEWVLTLGDWSIYSRDYLLSTRPSDFMLQHFRSFYAFTEDERWMTLHENILKAITDLYTHAPITGMLPDFARWDDGYFVPTSESFSWDACRVPWRVAMDYIIHGDDSALPMLHTLNNFIINATDGDPANVRAGYLIATGETIPPWNSPAFTSPFMVSAMINEEYQEWLDALWSFNASQNTWSGRYYDNTIRILCMIVASGNWWAPEYFK